MCWNWWSFWLSFLFWEVFEHFYPYGTFTESGSGPLGFKRQICMYQMWDAQLRATALQVKMKTEGSNLMSATVTSRIGLLCLSAQLVSAAFTQFSPPSVTYRGCHTVGGHPGCVTLAFSAPLFSEWSFPKNPQRLAWYLTTGCKFPRTFYLISFLGGTRSEATTLALE